MCSRLQSPAALVQKMTVWCSCLENSDSIQLDTYFVYPEELKTVARVRVFRDFVVSKAQRWPFLIGLRISPFFPSPHD